MPRLYCSVEVYRTKIETNIEEIEGKIAALLTVTISNAEFIGETARKLGTRLNEHRKSVKACDLKSVVSEHTKDTDHTIDWASVKIIGQEDQLLSRIDIYTQRLELNRVYGYNLPSMYGTNVQAHAANNSCITDEGILLGSKSSVKRLTNCWR